MKRSALILTLFLSALQMQAQSDTLCNEHKFRLAHWALPITLTAAGIWGQHNPVVTHMSNEIAEELQENIDRKITVDDYLQYSPTIAAFSLDLFGVPARHCFLPRLTMAAMAYTLMGLTVNSMKYTFHEWRPDHTARNSFPSGHTATAFVGAEILYQEYKHISPWIGYMGYAAAAATGFFRMYNNRHYLHDVIVGAGIGMLSAKAAYFLYPRLFGHPTYTLQTPSGHKVQVGGLPYFGNGEVGLVAAIRF